MDNYIYYNLLMNNVGKFFKGKCDMDVRAIFAFCRINYLW